MVLVAFQSLDRLRGFRIEPIAEFEPEDFGCWDCEVVTFNAN